MDTLKYKNLFLLINAPLMLIFFILLISSFFIPYSILLYFMGIAARIIFGIWCIFNGIWNACTDYYSFFKNNVFAKSKNSPKWAWWILFVLGVGCIITALLGYGFNNVHKPM